MNSSQSLQQNEAEKGHSCQTGSQSYIKLTDLRIKKAREVRMFLTEDELNSQNATEAPRTNEENEEMHYSYAYRGTNSA